MKVANVAALKSVVDSHGMTMDDEGVVRSAPKPQPPQEVRVVHPQNDELIASMKSLETALMRDTKDEELTAAIQSLESAFKQPRTTVFTVERNFEGITKITARTS